MNRIRKNSLETLTKYKPWKNNGLENRENLCHTASISRVDGTIIKRVENYHTTNLPADQ
jgi:hypothetical protein